MWTIYHRPPDYPIFFVVRRFVITPDRTVPDREARLAIDLHEARTLIPPGLIRMPRDVRDDPHVVESWF